ncbi:MAG TPA: type IV secretion system protein [Steroidobacteraceae bacterium]|nr:type IV secretion system protein [Steroidobacteraceae bacterium]
MRVPHLLGKSISICIALLVSAAAHAQFAVIDVAAIAQLVQQVELMEQALGTAEGELQQAEAAYRAITGARGMESLLSGVQRNYMPTSSTQLQALLNQNGSSYTLLASSMQSSLAANAVLTPQQLQALPPDSAAHLQSVRRTTALLQAIVADALANASGRFTSLQQLIAAIALATDQKGSLDLHARTAAEQAMLQNEQTKLEVLYRALEAQQWTNNQQAREQIVADHGDFSTRFMPAP